MVRKAFETTARVYPFLTYNAAAHRLLAARSAAATAQTQNSWSLTRYR